MEEKKNFPSSDRSVPEKHQVLPTGLEMGALIVLRIPGFTRYLYGDTNFRWKNGSMHLVVPPGP